MCLNPVKLPQPDGSVRIVPCGHCLQCVKAYQQTWVARLSEEFKSWILPGSKEIPVVFFTLTYNQESIPKNYLQVTTSGVHLTKSPLFETSKPAIWNTTIKESKVAANDRQNALEKEFRMDVQCYIDSIGALEEDEFFQNSEDLPSWMFSPDDHPIGLPISRCLAFNSVRYSDVRNWLKACRVYYDRKIATYYPVNYPDGSVLECNSRFVAEVNGSTLPKCAITKSFKYFICSEYGPVTLRPHYHGVLFGVTVKEFQDYFLPLWENRFGHVECTAFDPLKGGMLYISKYCSKGSFDNPLSCRDYFYPDGKEYHSKHYEYSISKFGVDLPICDPTFRVMSHGLGIRYAFIPSVRRFWESQIDENYVVRSVYGVSAPPTIEMLKLLGLSKTVDIKFINVTYPNFLGKDVNVELSSVFDDNLTRAAYIRKFSSSGLLVAESMLDYKISSSYEQEDKLASKKYSRVYSYREKDSEGRYTGKVLSKTAFSALPRYYHRWLLSPAAKLQISAAAIRRSLALDENRQRQLLALRSSDEKICMVRQFDLVEDLERKGLTEKLQKSANRFYSKLDYQDLLDANVGNS